jgi:hypothetical protein
VFKKSFSFTKTNLHYRYSGDMNILHKQLFAPAAQNRVKYIVCYKERLHSKEMEMYLFSKELLF